MPKIKENARFSGKQTDNRKMRIYTCSECYLYFTIYDVHNGIFDIESQKCIRCIIDDEMKNKNLEYPDCYAKEYDGSSQICTKDCALRKSCLVATSEDLFKIKPENNKKDYYKSHIARILRAVGSPVHIWDLAPTLDKETKGRFKFKGHDREKSYANLRGTALAADDVVFIGQGFFVYAGYWDLEKGGVLCGRHLNTFKDPRRLLKIEQINKILDEKSCQLRGEIKID